ncbi:MAG: hypothetical protein IJG16_06645 [Clostridia bacterium]|nr:hypothetical protein [Clostridia bacterium]
MKKILIIVAIMCGLVGISAQAANGDVIGHIYSTDIRAYINDVEVTSYNIGGRTAVVIEDLFNSKYYKTSYDYNDHTRTLTIDNFDPFYFADYSAQIQSTIGDITGNIYETDIKTVMYDTEIPSYNIGGKTAVVIEDLGSDNEFSYWGGRYVWDESNRTIKLKLLYPTSGDLNILAETNTDMLITANDELTEGYAEFKEVFASDQSEHFKWPDWVEKKENESSIKTIFPIISTTDNGKECIGYYFRCPSAEHTFTAFTCYDLDKYRAAAENAVPMGAVTIEEAVDFYQLYKAAYIADRIDTDDYSFVYMAGPAPYPHKYLLYVKSDGSFHDYNRDLAKIENKGDLKSIEIDKGNEQVICHYDNDYIIDLKFGELRTTHTKS